MEANAYLFIGLVIASVISIGWPRHQADPMGQASAPPKQGEQIVEPAINRQVKDSRWLEAYKQQIALGGEPNSLNDQMVLQTVSDIVNNRSLSQEAQFHMLDALQMRVWNDHPRGMRAEVIETIDDEMQALSHPEWHGRFGTFKSVRRS